MNFLIKVYDTIKRETTTVAVKAEARDIVEKLNKLAKVNTQIKREDDEWLNKTLLNCNCFTYRVKHVSTIDQIILVKIDENRQLVSCQV